MTLLYLREEILPRIILVCWINLESDILFLDEFGCNISMRQQRGRSLIGTKAISVVPTWRSRNVSVCATMSVNDIVIIKYKITYLTLNYL